MTNEIEAGQYRRVPVEHGHTALVLRPWGIGHWEVQFHGRTKRRRVPDEQLLTWPVVPFADVPTWMRQ